MGTVNLLLLIGFFIGSFGNGSWIARIFVKNPGGLLWVISSVVLGNFISVWAVYMFSLLFQSQQAAVITVTGIGLGFLFRAYTKGLFRQVWRLSWPDVAALAGAIAISTWIMFKTFHTGLNGMMLIEANEVFDYGHALSVIRSFSAGANMPYTSPFIAGEAHVYHFLFYFWAGLLERFGLPIVYAFNIPGIYSLVLLLMMVYEIAKFLYSSATAGLLAIFFTLTHSTLTFWYFLRDPKNVTNPIGAVWHNSTYYFAGPYDGSVISIFWTLNVFVNQRHLIFGMAVVLVLYFMVLEAENNRKKIGILGVLTGLLVWWHTTLFIAAVFIIGTFLLLRKRFAPLILYMASSTMIALIQVLPWLNQMSAVRLYEGQRSSLYYFLSDDFIGLIRYWWMNLGISLLTIPAGFFFLKKNMKQWISPFFVLFCLANFLRFGSHITENHKFLNLVFVTCGILSAGFVARLFRKGLPGFVLSAFVVILLSLSGIIDLMVIKNDFQYPVADYQASPLMRFIRDGTSPGSVFLSYQDIFDPVALAGRKTFFGFFGAKAYPARSMIAKTIYEATDAAALMKLDENNIDYIVFPKWKKDDFSYATDQEFARRTLRGVYEDDRHVVFATH